MLAIDSETTGVDLKHDARPFLVTTCNEEGEQHFWEWFVDPLTRMPEIPQEEINQVDAVIREAELLVLQNCKFDVAALKTIGITDWPWERVFDTLMAGHLLASNHRHDLTSMALDYLWVNIEPFEVKMKKACEEARRLAKKQFPDWKIAKEGMAGMPSAKGETNEKQGKGAEKTSPWKFDTWLPRRIAKELNYPLVLNKDGSIDKKRSHLWWYVTQEYANADSAVTAGLYPVMKERIEARGLQEIFKSRMKVLPVAYRIEQRGVTISGERLAELEGEYTKDSKEAEAVCLNIANSFDYNLKLPKGSRNKSLESFVWDVLKLPKVLSQKTKSPTIDKNAMEEYSITLPRNSKSLTFIKTLTGKRKKDTSLTFMSGYREFWRPLPSKSKWYILNPSLNPTATATLRWSSSNPNSQNVSKNEVECKQCGGDGCSVCSNTGIEFRSLRYLFGPAPGREWWALDYENIELRIPAYGSGEQVMIDLFERPDDAPYFGSYHLLNASIVYPDLFWPLAEQKGAFKKKYASTNYQWIKNFGFADQYGAVLGSGTADRAAHKPGAQEMIASKLKEKAKLNQRMLDMAEEFGYVETMPDRDVDPTRGYPILCTRSACGRILPTVPLSYHVQSTAMQCTGKAMIRCDEYLEKAKSKDAPFITLQVHDEIVFDFPAGGIKNLPKVNHLKKLMEQSGEDIGVPLRVAASYHPHTWSESQKAA